MPPPTQAGLCFCSGPELRLRGVWPLWSTIWTALWEPGARPQGPALGPGLGRRIPCPVGATGGVPVPFPSMETNAGGRHCGRMQSTAWVRAPGTLPRSSGWGAEWKGELTSAPLSGRWGLLMQLGSEGRSCVQSFHEGWECRTPCGVHNDGTPDTPQPSLRELATGNRE